MVPYDSKTMYHHETEITLGLIRVLALTGTREERLARLIAIIDGASTAMKATLTHDEGR